MFSTFCDKCEMTMVEKHSEMVLDFSKLYGLVVSAGLYVANNPYGKKVTACGEEAQGVWSDFADDFSCLPNTGIWGDVAKSDYMDKFDTVENVEGFYTVLFDFFQSHMGLFDDRLTA